MKNTLLVFGLMILSLFSYGQIIDIPDPNFKNALLNTNCVDINNDGIGESDADQNNDGEIEISESLLIKSLNISEKSIDSLIGIENFVNLERLDCSKNKLGQLSLLNFNKLSYLDCGSNLIENFTIQNLGSLTYLNIRINRLRELTIIDLPYLTLVDCSFNNIANLTCSGLPILYSINCASNNLTQLFLNDMPLLDNISCALNKIETLSLSNLPKLNELTCHQNKLSNLTSLNVPSLKYLYCEGNNLVKLNLSQFTNLKTVNCSHNQTTELSSSNLLKLETLNCSHNNLTHLQLINTPVLREINCDYNQFELLDLKSETLYNLKCNNNQITHLQLTGLPNLNILDCSRNQLSNLDASSLKYSRIIDCSQNPLSELILPSSESLVELDCSRTSLTQLNISNLSSINFLDLNGSPIKYLFAKFGKEKQFGIFTDFDSPLEYICTDDINLDYFKSIFPTANVNSYCTFIPGGQFYLMSGNIKFDQDNNECNNNNLLKSKIKFSLKSILVSGTYISNSIGSYFIPFQEGTYTIIPFPENPDYFNVSPDSIIVTFPSTSDTLIQDFCITPKGFYKQVDLSIIPSNPQARPGFDASYIVVMTNKGNQIENGTLYFSYEEPKLDFESTNVTPSTQSDGLISWNFTDLLPFETRYYYVTLNVNSPSETPPVNVGDELLITCNILDNVFLLKQEVVGSYDPNDKTCLEGKTITPEQVGEYVHYLIRFENTGNYAAENVVVKDVLDESTFDISTLQITDASHESWARINGNVVEFIFEKIQLPFDDASNDGYICFKIKTKPILVLGNELKNEANIYFDYNLPILTNKTNTVVANPVSTDEAIGESDIKSFPNPVSDVLKFSSDDKILKVEIFDMSGRLVQVSSVVDGEVNVEGLLSGAYRLKVYTQLGTRNGKMVKI